MVTPNTLAKNQAEIEDLAAEKASITYEIQECKTKLARLENKFREIRFRLAEKQKKHKKDAATFAVLQNQLKF